MKNSSAARAGTALRGSIAAGLLALSPHAITATPEATTAPGRPASAAPTPGSPTPPATSQPSEAQRRLQWQREIAKVPLPSKGCFSASYPAQEWREVACAAPSKYPNQPGTPPLPNNVGNGNSVHAQSSGLISSATGSFDSVTPATVTASGPRRGNPTPPAPDAFSLQLNTQFFQPLACANVAGCYGWQQFIYSRYQCTPGPCIFIEYWLFNFGATCPTGWLSLGSGNACYLNSPSTNAPAMAAADLQQAALTAKAAGGPGGTDEIRLITAGGTATAATSTNLLQLEQHWNGVEWNVVGDCCLSRVDFSAATSIVARVTLNDGSTNAPTCVVGGFTAEANNLNFGPNAPVRSGAGPALMFMQSDPGGSLATNCAAATSFGDTHLNTFNGLLYDFQASGDFVLLQADPEFVVQVRQVSGAPNWPDASVNKAVATLMGKTQPALTSARTEWPPWPLMR